MDKQYAKIDSNYRQELRSQILKLDTYVNYINEEGDSLMITLVKMQEFELVKILMRRIDISVNYQNFEGETAAIVCAQLCAEGNIKAKELLKVFLNDHAMLPCLRDNKGYTLYNYFDPGEDANWTI